MEIVTLQPGTDLHSIVRLVSKKRKAILAKPSDAVTLTGLYWEDGSRSDYFIIHVASKQVTPLAHVSPPQFGGPAVAPVQALQAGYAVVEAGVFCGRPATPVVYLPLPV